MIVNTGLRRFNGAGFAGARKSMSLLLDFVGTGSLTPSRVAGSAPTITNTRATTATIADQDGIIRTALANEMRMGGFRRVANLV